MADKDQDNRIFVGGLAFDVTERQLQSAFSRFGKILDCQVMLERDTGRPRGFGFLTFADSRAMEDAIRDMHGRELGDRAISVNKAQPKMASEEPAHGYRGGYSSGGGRGGYDRPAAAGQDDCFKCGRPGHWARDCPSGGGGGGGRGGGRAFSPPRSTRYAGVAGSARGDRYAGDRGDRYIDDRSDRGRYGDRDRFDNRDDRYGARDRYVNDRYPQAVERFPVDRYGASERYPPNGYGKDRAAAYDRDGGGPALRGVGDRYVGGGGGPAGRYEGKSYNHRERPGPYDRPRRGGGGRPPSLDRY